MDCKHSLSEKKIVLQSQSLKLLSIYCFMNQSLSLILNQSAAPGVSLNTAAENRERDIGSADPPGTYFVAEPVIFSLKCIGALSMLYKILVHKTSLVSESLNFPMIC